MTSNRAIAILLGALLLCIVVIAKKSFQVNNLKGDIEIRKIDLKKKDKQLRLKGDSIKLLEVKNAQLDSLWSGVVKDQLKAIIQEREKVKIANAKYESLKNRPVPHWTSTDLDSILSSVIGHH